MIYITAKPLEMMEFSSLSKRSGNDLRKLRLRTSHGHCCSRSHEASCRNLESPADIYPAAPERSVHTISAILLRVGDNHLFRLSHCPDTQNSASISSVVRRYSGAWLSAVGKALAGHDDPPVNLILRIQEMDIAGSDHRLLELFSQSDDPFVDLNQILFILDAQLLISES